MKNLDEDEVVLRLNYLRTWIADGNRPVGIFPENTLFEYNQIILNDVVTIEQVDEFVSNTLALYYSNISSAIGNCLENDKSSFVYLVLPQINNYKIEYSVKDFCRLLLDGLEYWYNFNANVDYKLLISNGIDIEKFDEQMATILEELLLLMLVCKIADKSKLDRNSNKSFIANIDNYFSFIFKYYENIEDYEYCTSLVKFKEKIRETFKVKKFQHIRKKQED